MKNRGKGIKLERKAVSRIVLTVVLIGMSTLAFHVQTVAAQDWWPMFHHDLSHTGYSTSAAPDTNEVSWSYTTDYDVASSPAVTDGKVYVGSNDNKVYAFGPPLLYDVTIEAYCYTEGAPVSVSITLDGVPTGEVTPHTFTGLTGAHTFTVPDTDPNGHPFEQWNTGETSTTIT